MKQLAISLSATIIFSLSDIIFGIKASRAKTFTMHMWTFLSFIKLITERPTLLSCRKDFCELELILLGMDFQRF